MMTECEINVKSISSGRSLTVFLEGDIDHHNARQIRSRIDTKVYIQRPDELVLDLSRVSFMDSSGLGLILGRAEKASELDCSVRLFGLSPALMKLVRLCGVDRVKNLSFTK